jgi:hypothetical protein
MTRLVSCIVPAYNAERYLGDSILGQTYGQVEVLVCDDGSTDGTGDVVHRYGAVASPVDVDGRAPYVPPALHIYRDMGQLLALDPPTPGLMDIDWKDPGDKP